MTRPVLRDARVRVAIAAAIDRQRIVRDDTAGTGILAYADLPPLMYHPTRGYAPAFDPAHAAALLDAAGWRAGSDGVRRKNGVALQLDLISAAGSVTGKIIDLQVQQMLARVGIATTLRYFGNTLYNSPASAGGPVQSGAFDIASFVWVGGVDPDNSPLFTCANRAPAGFNAARYCSPQMDRLQQASLNTLDPTVRARLVGKIEDLLVRDAPFVFLYHTPTREFMDPALRRPAGNLVDPWYRLERWSFAG